MLWRRRAVSQSFEVRSLHSFAAARCLLQAQYFHCAGPDDWYRYWHYYISQYFLIYFMLNLVNIYFDIYIREEEYHFQANLFLKAIWIRYASQLMLSLCPCSPLHLRAYRNFLAYFRVLLLLADIESRVSLLVGAWWRDISQRRHFETMPSSIFSCRGLPRLQGVYGPRVI